MMMTIEGVSEVRYNIDLSILKYHYAFEVDLEKMEGRYLFNTKEKIDQRLAEKIMLERCDYKYIASSCTQNKKKHKPIIFNSGEVWGLTYDKHCIFPAGETMTTILATEKGFICQLLPGDWLVPVYTGDTIFLLTSGANAEYYPILVTNSPLDI